MIKRCSRCGVEVRHEITQNGNVVVLTMDTDPEGSFVLELRDDGPAEARWVASFPPELRAETHRTVGLYRRHQEVCSPLTLEGVS